MKTRQIRRNRILEVAFEEWGKKNYSSTSLSLLTRRLRITKPALYRYFPSKLGLIQALEEDFNQAYTAMHAEFVQAAGDKDLEWFVGEFIARHQRFFSQRRYSYQFFLLHLMRKPEVISQAILPLGGRVQALLAERLRRSGADCRDEALPLAMRFLYSNAIFWLSSVYLAGKHPFASENGGEADFSGRADGSAPGDIECNLEFARTLCMRGMLLTREPDPDYGQVERRAAVSASEMLPPDRLFSAIEASVAEVGLADASIDRIAAKVGMSKSSLYFYFQNKDEMLGRTIAREQEHMIGLVDEKVMPLDGFSRRSYAYMVMICSYALNNPSFLTVFSWLRFQNIGFPMNPLSQDTKKRFFAFFMDAAASGLVRTPGRDALRAASFLHVLAFREVMDSMHRPEGSRQAVFDRLRTLHKLYLNGFSAREVDE